MGVSAGSQKKQDRWNSEERRASWRKRVETHPPSQGRRIKDPTEASTTLDIRSYPLPFTVVAKIPPEFKGLGLRLGACPPKSRVIYIWVNSPSLESRGCSPPLSSLLPPGAGASNSLGPRCSEWRSSSEGNMQKGGRHHDPHRDATKQNQVNKWHPNTRVIGGSRKYDLGKLGR